MLYKFLKYNVLLVKNRLAMRFENARIAYCYRYNMNRNKKYC